MRNGQGFAGRWRMDGRGYFDGLTGMRGLLALWVVVGHVLFNSGYHHAEMTWPLSLLAEPIYAVRGFMILSGFVIAHLVITKREPYGVYIWRRWLRLFPLLCVCVSALLLIAAVSPDVFPHVTRKADRLAPYIAATFLMIQGAIPNQVLQYSATGILAPAWSTSLEWQFYLFAPLLVWPLLTKRYWLLAIMILIAYPLNKSGYVIAGRLYSFGPNAFLPNSALYFLLGIAGYGAAMRRPAIMGAFDVFAGPSLVWLGKISYSIYLTHIIVLHSVRVFLLPDSVPLTGPERLLWLGVPTVAITLGIAWLTYRFVEEPFMNLGRGKRMFRSALSPAE